MSVALYLPGPYLARMHFSLLSFTILTAETDVEIPVRITQVIALIILVPLQDEVLEGTRLRPAAFASPTIAKTKRCNGIFGLFSRKQA